MTVAVADGPVNRTSAAAAPIRTAPASSDPVAPSEAIAAVRGVPRRLVVPALGIDSAVLPIGTDDGVLVPPSDPSELGWWRDGARIGAAHGSVLITGHTVHTGGGAMDHLADLEVGDEVTVETRTGVAAYRVVSVTYFPKQTLAAHATQVFDQSGPHRLVLITCDNWNGSAYDGNTAAIAQPIAQPVGP